MKTPLPTNRSMPHCAIIPVLAYADVGEAINWLCQTFGFTERWRVGSHRAQLTFNGGTIAITGLPHPGETAPIVPVQTLLVRVVDVDGHYQYARQQGAQIVEPPADYPYGERQYTTKDIGGHTWSFSQSIADVAPEDWGGTSNVL
jgi:uncharacterized glyoxalase superfamily protein PhnB